VLLEEEAQVEEGLAQDPALHQHQHDQQPPQTPVAIEERVDRLELHVDKGRHHQPREVIVGMEETLQIRHAALHQPRGRRYEAGVASSGATDPVLAVPELTRQSIGATPTGEQHGMNLPQQTGGEGETTGQPGRAVFERRHVTRNLRHIIERHSRRLLQLKQQEVRQGRLGALDLGGEQGFPPHVGVEKQLGIGKKCRHAI
jgi:hypothetical protein